MDQRKKLVMATTIKVVELYVVFQGLKWQSCLPYVIISMFGS